MKTMNRQASIEEKMDHIMSRVRALEYKERISRHDLTGIIMKEWGSSRETIRMALDALERFDRVKAINPHVYVIIGSWKDETTAEELFIAKSIQPDVKGILAKYQERHPKGMKGGPSQAQDMHWIGATKGKYGLQDMSDEDLYNKLQEGLK